MGYQRGQLPPGSTIRYRQPGAWELYRPQIIGAGVLLLLQTALIVALLVQRARRRRTERALRESQQRYALATAAGAVGVWDWNFETNDIYVDPTLKVDSGVRGRGDHHPRGGLGIQSPSPGPRGGDGKGAGVHRRRDR